MQTLYKPLITAFLLFCSVTIFAQDKAAETKAIVTAGIKLHDEGKYDEAIKKYNEALKIDPTNYSALYETAYSYYTANKPDDAIPVLEKFIGLYPSAAAGFDMLGNIYDDKGNADKAIAYYKQGIKADATYQRVHFNLGIAYHRQKLYAEAEKAAIQAIKLDPKHASSQRLYALATLKLNKRANSLLAWCSFLLLEPQSKRSPEAVDYIKYLVNFGIKREANGNTTTTIAPNDIAFSIAVIGATSNKKNLSSVDSLSLQLPSLLQVLDAKDEKTDVAFYTKFFSDYFKDMANTGNVAAFTHYATLSAYKDEDVEWFKTHDADLKRFDNWASTTKRDIQ